MLSAVLSLLAIFIFLVSVEIYWRRKKLPNELSRQIIHICVGVFVAFWPYYMSYRTIMYCALALFIVILLGRFNGFIKLIKWPDTPIFKFAGRQLKFIESIHDINRPSLGDLIFPASIGLIAAFQPAEYIFTIAMLNVGVADGLASLFGNKFGSKHIYKVFEQKKTAVGSLTFWFVSLLILVLVKTTNLGGGAALSWETFIYLPVLLTAAENFAVYGTDDLVVPLLVLITLSWY